MGENGHVAKDCGDETETSAGEERRYELHDESVIIEWGTVGSILFFVFPALPLVVLSWWYLKDIGHQAFFAGTIKVR